VTVIHLPGGGTTVATPTGDGGYTAVLPSGDQLTHAGDGTTSLNHLDGSTDHWDANGKFTGTDAPPNDPVPQTPQLTHDVVVPMNGGGYRIDHPDGSSDVHWPDGTVVHVEPDGVHWHQVSGPVRPPTG
jgi:hypothetical protein